MRIIDSTILAALGAGELKVFQLLEMTLDGGTYRYTDCDVPIGSQLVKQVITDGYANHGLCLADGAAFVRLNGLDLSPYANSGFLLSLIDSADKITPGSIGAADAAEALAGELFENIGFETAGAGAPDVFANWSETATWGTSLIEQDAVVFNGGANSAKLTQGDTLVRIWQSNTVTAGKLYKISFYTRGDGTNAGRYWVYDVTNTASIISLRTTGVTAASWTQVTVYVTAPSGCASIRLYLYPPSAVGSFANFDDVSFQEVSDSGVDGVHIVSAAGGSTRNWASIESGFNYNDSTYTAILSFSRFEPRGFKHDGARYSLGRIVDKVSLEIDNLDETLSSEFIGGSPQGSTVSLKEVVLNSSNQVMGHPVTWFSGTLDDWDADEGRIRMSVVGPNYAWSRKTTSRHPSSCRWRIFKGDECEYAGTESFCDRSYTRCAALGNTGEFGGFRWLSSIEGKDITWGRVA
jgi:hypothetical protein